MMSNTKKLNLKEFLTLNEAVAFFNKKSKVEITVVDLAFFIRNKGLKLSVYLPDEVFAAKGKLVSVEEAFKAFVTADGLDPYSDIGIPFSQAEHLVFPDSPNRISGLWDIARCGCFNPLVKQLCGESIRNSESGHAEGGFQYGICLKSAGDKAEYYLLLNKELIQHSWDGRFVPAPPLQWDYVPVYKLPENSHLVIRYDELVRFCDGADSEPSAKTENHKHATIAVLASLITEEGNPTTAAKKVIEKFELKGYKNVVCEKTFAKWIAEGRGKVKKT